MKIKKETITITGEFCSQEQWNELEQKIDIAINNKLRGLKPITSIKGWKGLATFTAGVMNSTYFHARSNLADLKQKPRFLVQGRLTSPSNGKFKIAGLGLVVDIKLPKNCRVTYAIVEPSKLTIFYNEFTMENALKIFSAACLESRDRFRLASEVTGGEFDESLINSMLKFSDTIKDKSWKIMEAYI